MEAVLKGCERHKKIIERRKIKQEKNSNAKNFTHAVKIRGPQTQHKHYHMQGKKQCTP